MKQIRSAAGGDHAAKHAGIQTINILYSGTEKVCVCVQVRVLGGPYLLHAHAAPL